MRAGSVRAAVRAAPIVGLLAVAFVVSLALAAASGAARKPPKPHEIAPVPQVEIGDATLSAPLADGGAVLLVPVRYPIQFSGRLSTLNLEFNRPEVETVSQTLTLHERVGAGRIRAGDRRLAFGFVHRVGLKPSLARELREGLEVRVEAGGDIDVDGDGNAELRRLGRVDPGPVAKPAEIGGRGQLCNSVPRISVGTGKSVSIPLPACTRTVDWRIAERPRGGTARIRNGRLVYRAPSRDRGSQSLLLRGRVRGGGSGDGRVARAAKAAQIPEVPVQITVGPASGAVVRALGDSVTAGFGYYGDGEPMSVAGLPECRPVAPYYDDACSSNSDVTSNDFKLRISAPDWGLANNVSWAAQWANEYGVTNFENLAVSGSEPREWAPGGTLHEITAELESEDPDYVLLTLGANPLLSELLFGIDHMGCAVYADIFGDFRECAQSAFAGVELRTQLRAVYADLVAHTNATIFLMQYHLSVPASALAYSSTQIAEFGHLLNEEIATAAGEVGSPRLRVVAPPHFDVGLDISPVYPDDYSCSKRGDRVDGPSVQSAATQSELRVLHPFAFCEGPVPKGPPWVISADTGIHPSATGYTQMASRVPAPAP